ncbi:hypothetical protein [Streptomyces nigrescens]
MVGKVDRNYWVPTDRQEAEDKATAFVVALRRLDLEFHDIEFQDLCDECRPPRTDYEIRIGRISVKEASEFAEKLDQALDQLAQYQKLYGPLEESTD